MWHRAPKGLPEGGGDSARAGLCKGHPALEALNDAHPGLGPAGPGADGGDAGLSPGDTHGHFAAKGLY